MSVAVAAPTSPTYGKVPFLLRALGAIRIKDDGTPFEEDIPKENKAEDDETEDSTPEDEIPEDFVPEFRKYGLMLLEPLPLPKDPSEEQSCSIFLLPELSDAECKEHLERICTYEGEGAFPWEEMNNKILQGAALNHITDEEFAQWSESRDYHIGRLEEKNGTKAKVTVPDTEKDAAEKAADEKELAEWTRVELNDLLWWAVAIDLCCEIDNIDGFFEWFGVKEITLGFFEMGINIVVGLQVEDELKAAELKLGELKLGELKLGELKLGELKLGELKLGELKLDESKKV